MYIPTTLHFRTNDSFPRPLLTASPEAFHYSSFPILRCVTPCIHRGDPWRLLACWLARCSRVHLRVIANSCWYQSDETLGTRTDQNSHTRVVCVKVCTGPSCGKGWLRVPSSPGPRPCCATCPNRFTIRTHSRVLAAAIVIEQADP